LCQAERRCGHVRHCIRLTSVNYFFRILGT
jgi:hypothetical protein